MKMINIYIPLSLIFLFLLTVITPGTISPATTKFNQQSPLSLLLTSPDWFSVKTRHFVIRYTKKDTYFAQELKNLAEKCFDNVTNHIGLYPTKKITIYIAASKETFLKLQPSSSKIGDQVIGLAYPNLHRILLLSPRAISSGHIQLKKIFIHELTHIVLGATYQNKSPVHIPKWFNEGLSMYEAKQWNWQYRMLMTRICLKGDIISFRELEHSFPVDSIHHINIAYAQSFSLISFILNKYGQDSLRDITRALIQGDKIDEALNKVIGLDLYGLEIVWKKHLRLIYTWVPVLTSSLTLWFVISLIFLLVYYQKKRTSKAKLYAWEEEEIEEWLKKELNDL